MNITIFKHFETILFNYDAILESVGRYACKLSDETFTEEYNNPDSQEYKEAAEKIQNEVKTYGYMISDIFGFHSVAFSVFSS